MVEENFIDTGYYKEPAYLTPKEVYNKKYEKLNSNIPVDLLLEPSDYSSSNGSIVHFPKIDDLEFNNIYWQSQKIRSSGVIYLYSAHYDNRELVDNSIRIISFAKTEIISSVKYCQLFFQDKKMVEIISISSAIPINFKEWDTHMFLLTCKMPPKLLTQIPAAVSVVESQYDTATNVLKVHYNPLEAGKEKQDFAICTKPLLYPQQDLSFYLVQYIELAKLLGIGKIFFHKYYLHPNMSAVMRYYEKQDQVDLTPFTNPGISNNLPLVMQTLWQIPRKTKLKEKDKRMSTQMERASQTDCFYRNMYKYKYITNFDLDEIMIPSNGKTLKEVIDSVISKTKKERGGLYTPPVGYMIPMGIFSESFQSSWTPGIPKYMSMLQNVNRTGYLRHYKGFMDTERLLGVSTHRPERCIGECIVQNLEESEAFLAHYRDLNPQGLGKDASELIYKVTDTRIWNYKDEMIKNVDKALKAIGLL